LQLRSCGSGSGHEANSGLSQTPGHKAYVIYIATNPAPFEQLWR
jgi:hypothetical protein